MCAALCLWATLLSGITNPHADMERIRAFMIAKIMQNGLREHGQDVLNDVVRQLLDSATEESARANVTGLRVDELQCANATAAVA